MAEFGVVLVDPSVASASRDAVRFERLIRAISECEPSEYCLVSRRTLAEETPFLDRIPEKTNRSPGWLSRFRQARTVKRHLPLPPGPADRLLAAIGKKADRELLIYNEGDLNDLAYDGSEQITKILTIARDRNGSVVGLKRIPFSEIEGQALVRGDLVTQGEYRIRSVFRTGAAIHSSSNLAMTERYYLKPSFFKILSEERSGNAGDPVIESFDRLARKEPVYGCLPFQPMKIR